MKRLEISYEDAVQVKAILMTHAEMQDHRTMLGEAVLGRLRVDEPGELDLIEDLEESNRELTDDSENLKRIAKLF